MGMRIRNAMFEQGELLKGIVEMDECYIGGKPRKGNSPRGGQNKRGRGTNKPPVVGMIKRGGRIVAKVTNKEHLKAKGLSKMVRDNVAIDDAKFNKPAAQ